MPKTVLELDLVGYSSICNDLEQVLDASSIILLNRTIQTLIDQGLEAVGAERKSTVMATTGDGAILVFNSPADAHRCAAAIHAVTSRHNQERAARLAKRVFRSGAATGEVSMLPMPGGGFEIAGTTIVRAVRLEAKAQPGALIVDEATFLGLTDGQKAAFGARKVVRGKRDEAFRAYECQLDPRGPKSAAHFKRNEPMLNKLVPKMVAKFTEENGELCPLSDEKVPAYWMELWIEDAPPETKSVTFEILDRGFNDPRWTIKRSARTEQSVREFFTDEMNSYGDVRIWARGAGRGAGSWSIKTTLYEALLCHYGAQRQTRAVRGALRQIRDQ